MSFSAARAANSPKLNRDMAADKSSAAVSESAAPWEPDDDE
jgi:hypothetical protein